MWLPLRVRLHFLQAHIVFLDLRSRKKVQALKNDCCEGGVNMGDQMRHEILYNVNIIKN